MLEDLKNLQFVVIHEYVEERHSRGELAYNEMAQLKKMGVIDMAYPIL
jgi:hypothetical protein